MQFKKIPSIAWPEDIIQYSLTFFPRAALRKSLRFNKDWEAAATKEIQERLKFEETPVYFTYGEPITIQQSGWSVPISKEDIYDSFSTLGKVNLFLTEKDLLSFLRRQAQLEGGLFAIIRQSAIFTVILSEYIKEPVLETISVGVEDVTYQVVAREDVTPLSGVLKYPFQEPFAEVGHVEYDRHLPEKPLHESPDPPKRRKGCSIL